MKKLTPIGIITAILLLTSCGKRIEVPITPFDSEVAFLFSLISVVLAIAVGNLAKGFDVLIKNVPEQPYTSLLGSRWFVRLLWGINLLFVILQLFWGMRLALEKVKLLHYFGYYVFLATLVYGMVAYVFPENSYAIFKKEKEQRLENYWSKSIVNRLYKLYAIYGAYIIFTSTMSIVFLIDNLSSNSFHGNIFTDGNIVGVLLKLCCCFIIISAWRLKGRQMKEIKKTGNPPDNKKTVIVGRDYCLIAFSLILHFYYIIIRTFELLPT